MNDVDDIVNTDRSVLKKKKRRRGKCPQVFSIHFTNPTPGAGDASLVAFGDFSSLRG